MSKELSKEEIIKMYEPYPNKADVNVIGIMMEEWAKQEAIGFSQWLDFNEPQYEKGHKWICAGVTYDHPPTTTELYNLYKQSKEKQP